MIEIYNEDCFETMRYMNAESIDLILTSPFYNTNKKAGKDLTLLNKKPVKEGRREWVRYDKHVDNMTTEEYCTFTINLFTEFNRILNKNGCVLYNISYGGQNPDCMFKAVNAIITDTPFTIADVITWKKKSALPNNTSKNKLTRICEFVFVFCRKSEYYSFYSNKKIKGHRETGQATYENIFNFIEAKNNDGTCPYNKATYSTDLCEKLLAIYAPAGGGVFDPFIGTGTTALACARMNLDCIGSEISDNQVKFAVNRIKNEFPLITDFYYEIKKESAR